MNRLTFVSLAILTTTALPFLVFADETLAPAWAGLDDVHLDVIPRTDAERARITAVTAQPTDFSAPWAFEENAGGA